MLRSFSLLLAGLCCLLLRAQNTIVQQGFEASVACPDWGYTGGVVTSEMASTGANSVRVGRSGEGQTTVTMAPVTITGYTNVQLSLRHAAKCGSGSGLDWSDSGGHEGAVIEVNLNGSGWFPIARMGGRDDACWSFTSAYFGDPINACGAQDLTSGVPVAGVPNPLIYNVPAGTTTIQVRAFSSGQNTCAQTVPGSFNRPDEGFYVDDLKLTTTSSVVTPSTGNVTWNGSVSTDWFDCRNWTPNVLPGPGWNVTIDQTAARDCVVGNGPATPMNAFCANLTVSKPAGGLYATPRLVIGNGRALKAAGPCTVQCTSGTGSDSAVVRVISGSLFESAGLTTTGTRALFQNRSAATNVNIKGDLLLASNGMIDVSNTGIGVAGDITNNVSAANFKRTPASNVIINGSTPQTISASFGTDGYASLSIYKEDEDLTLLSPIEVTGVLDLYLGRVFTSAPGLLTLKTAASVINANDGSFISGPVRKQGNSPFTFPTGKGSYYRPISISGNASGTGTFGTNLPTNHFTAEYFDASPNIAIGAPHDATLDHISDCEYWVLDRTGTVTTAQPFVHLSWDTPASCGVSLLSDMRVARWDGAAWRDRGNGATTGTTSTGTVATAAAQTAFSPWALASFTVQNPLPIQLLAFTAQPEGDNVRLSWTTLTEEDNDFFTVERSGDDLVFSAIAEVPAAGTSVSALHYTLLDEAPLQGLSYYRLRQTDLDGASTLSAIVPVMFDRHADRELQLAASAGHLFVRHPLAAGRYDLFDANGRLLRTGSATASSFDLPLQELPPGLYLVRVTSGSRALSARFMH